MSTFPSCLPCQPCDPRLFALPQTLLLLHEGAQAYGGQTQIIVILVWKNFDVKCQINNVISNGCGTNWKIMDPILRRKTMPPWRAWTRSCARVSHSIYGSMGLNWCPASDKYILEGRYEVSICVCQLSIPVLPIDIPVLPIINSSFPTRALRALGLLLADGDAQSQSQSLPT